MFTGIIEEIGTVRAVEELADAIRLTIAGPRVVGDAAYGDSIAVDGCCLTVTALDGDAFAVDVMKESLDRTTIGRAGAGTQVNLERATAAGGRLGGHLVQGHVDGTARIVARTPSEHWEVVRFALPPALARYVAEKGSVAVDGISLTVTDVEDGDQPTFGVSLIPATLEHTGLGSKQVGDDVNVEVDVLAKYVERLMASEGECPMSFADLYDAHLTFGGHDIAWREILGNLFGLASAVGGMRRKVWAWPVGIVGNVLLFTVFLGTAIGGHGAPLFGQAARQVFFIVVSVYGWQRWHANRGSADGPAVRPRWARAKERTAYLLVAGVSLVVCTVVFREVGAGWPAPSWYYLADSWIFVGSMLATYAMARGWVDFWLAWIAVDLVGVPELLHFGYYPSAVLYAVYAAFVVWGFVVWLRVARQQPQGVDDPSVETLGA